MDKLAKCGKRILFGTALVAAVSGCADGGKFKLGIENVVESNQRWNLEGLEPWQRTLFVKAGNYWNLNIIPSPEGDNIARFGDFPEEGPEYVEYVSPYVHEDGNIAYLIKFNSNLYFVDCSKSNGGYNFLETSEHALGHTILRKDSFDEFGGKLDEGEHSSNPKSVMFPHPWTCF